MIKTKPYRIRLAHVLLLVLFASPAAVLAAASADTPTLQMYVDQNTKQIFSEPGPNRVKMGEVKPAGAPAASGNAPAKTSKNWADVMKIRGYVQLRHNQILGGDETMPGSTNSIRHPADRSIGKDTNFLVRRARLIFSGDVSERLSYYVQPDLASSAGDTGGLAQLRDVYGDVYLNKDRVHRIRFGQSKIPYGFENLQSSQNRIALDRSDALNSCCRDERDLGAFYYYTPADKQELFKRLVDGGLKGSGNYGVFALGAYNGTGANRPENNDSLHLVSRFTYPVKFGSGQIVEAGLQAISGKFKPATAAAPASLPASVPSDGFRDERIGVHAVIYPQPFGLQAEWNWGRGPQLNDGLTAIETKSLAGGYMQAMYMAKDFYGYGTLTPFVKWQHFDGGQKFETNAPRNQVNDWEAGFEWQPNKEIEFTAYYSKLDRTNIQTPTSGLNYQQYNTDVLRMQLQFNF